jgi:hypothetical protein
MQGHEHLRAQARKEPVQAMHGEKKERIEGKKKVMEKKKCIVSDSSSTPPPRCSRS